MLSCLAVSWLISLKSPKGIEPRASPHLLESNFLPRCEISKHSFTMRTVRNSTVSLIAPCQTGAYACEING